MKQTTGRRKSLLAHRFTIAIVSSLVALCLRILGATWRIEEDGPDPLESPDGPQLGALWHRNVLIAAYVFRDRGFSTTASLSRDGDLITAMLLRLGYVSPARGSSSSGAAGLLMGIYRAVQGGTTVAFPTDGPRGPARVSKSGVATLSRLTGRPIIPVAFSASPSLRFSSWDETLLPLPFSRVRLRYGSPRPILARSGSDDQEEEACRALDRELNRLTDELDSELGLASRKAEAERTGDRT